VTTARKTLSLIGAVTVLALGGTAAASAAPQAVQAPQAAAAPCDRLATSIEVFGNLRDATARAIAQLQQRIASGTLRPGPLRAARALVGALQRQLVGMDAMLGRLEDRYALLCTDGGDEGGGGGGEEQPPPQE
jgi:hypothetical protein